MIFDLRGAHLGDTLMAMPAMRAGDCVISRHRVACLPVSWLDAGMGILADAVPGRHTTDAWLSATGRLPARHKLQPALPKPYLVIAPYVEAKSKRWNGWAALKKAIPHSLVVGPELCRYGWMALLNMAHTVICPDTGTAHMADALGCPRVIALHGVSANWPRCAPYWNRSSCIARESMDKITVNDVLERVYG